MFKWTCLNKTQMVGQPLLQWNLDNMKPFNKNCNCPWLEYVIQFVLMSLLVINNLNDPSIVPSISRLKQNTQLKWPPHGRAACPEVNTHHWHGYFNGCNTLSVNELTNLLKAIVCVANNIIAKWGLQVNKALVLCAWLTCQHDVRLILGKDLYLDKENVSQESKFPKC